LSRPRGVETGELQDRAAQLFAIILPSDRGEALPGLMLQPVPEGGGCRAAGDAPVLSDTAVGNPRS